MIGNLGDMLNSLAKPPSRSKGSQTPTPAASTRTRISFASNSGTGSSRIFISFKPPNRSIATVFIVFFMVGLIEHPPIINLTLGKAGGYVRGKAPRKQRDIGTGPPDVRWPVSRPHRGLRALLVGNLDGRLRNRRNSPIAGLA